MEVIFHEKQEGSLCAQHCLNVLLQGEYFTAVDLASLAQGLDDAERQHMAEGGVHSEEYRRFLQQPSTNMDDSGYFSVQVIASALKVWNLELIPFNSQNPIALMAKENPLCQGAFICNYKDHWFTVRKLGQQWFNLNSLLSGPELISDTYLIMFLAQLEQEGYSIFVVLGELPECEADSVLKHTRVTQTTKPVLLSDASTSKQQSLVTSSRSCESQRPDVFDEDLIIQEALRRSLQDSVPSSSEPYAEVSSTIHTVQGSYSSDLPRSKNPDCLKAVGESLDSVKGDAESEVTASSDAIAALSNSNGLTEENENGDYMTEEEMLEVAIKMSMDPS